MKDVSELDKLWQASQIRVTDEIAVAPEVLFCNGSVIGTLGNFSASTGKAKSKKTFNVSAIVTAVLMNGEVLRYVAEFPDDKRTILYFDTEQSPYHCQKVIRRALQLAGLPLDRHPDNLIFAQLRAQVPDTRLAYIIHRGVAENAAMAGHGARASKFQLDIKSVLDFWVSAGQFWAA